MQVVEKQETENLRLNALVKTLTNNYTKLRTKNRVCNFTPSTPNVG